MFAPKYTPPKFTLKQKIQRVIRYMLDRIFGDPQMHKPDWYIWMYRNILNGVAFTHFQMPWIGKWKYDDMFRGRDGDWYVRKEWIGRIPAIFNANDFISIQPLTSPTGLQFKLQFK